MKIAVDLDDTIWDFYDLFADYCNYNYGFNTAPLELGTDFYRALGSKEKSLSIIRDFVNSGKGDDLEIYSDFLEYFNFLKDNFEVVFITSRSYDKRELTKKVIEQKLGSEVEIIYVVDYDPHFKSYVCRLHNVDLLIDDFSFNARDCADKGIKVLLLDKPWNQGVEHDNIFRCKDWSEVVEKLKEFGGKDD